MSPGETCSQFPIPHVFAHGAAAGTPGEERPALQIPCPAPRGLLLCACHAALHGALCQDAPQPSLLTEGVCEIPLGLHHNQRGVKGGHISCGHPSAGVIWAPWIAESGIIVCYLSPNAAALIPAAVITALLILQTSDISASSGVGAFQRKQDPASPRSCF